MTRLDEHRDLMRNVHKELKSLQSCRLTDWLHIPKRYPLFHEPFNRSCPCEKCDPEPLCPWCKLYAEKYISIEFMVFETKLQRVRDELGCYEDDKYEQFITLNLPRFRDILLSTALTILLPMLTFMAPGQYQCNYRRIRSNASFASVSIAHVFLVDGMIKETGATQFRNPRVVKEFTEVISKARNANKKKKTANEESEQ